MSAFEQALQEFGDSIGNRKITISRILQYAIEVQNRALYEEYAEKYFQVYQNVDEGLSIILNKDRLDLFELLVFLKGIYTFYIKDVTVEFQNQLVQLLEAERLT